MLPDIVAFSMTSRNTAFWNTVTSAVIDDLKDICNVAGLVFGNLYFISPFQHFVIFNSEVTLSLKRKYVCSRMCWVMANQA